MLSMAMSKVEGLSAFMTQSLVMRMSWAGGSVKLDIKLSKTSKISLKGEAVVGKVELAMENIDQLIKIPTITLL